MTTFSSRLPTDLTPGRLQRALAELRAAGTPLIDLTNSNPPQCGLGPDAGLLARALAVPEAAEYHPDPRGMLGARRRWRATTPTAGCPPSRTTSS